MKEKKIIEFRNGIFSLHTRRFGTVAEIMIKRLYGLEESGTLAFDKKEKTSNKRIEIKFSTVLKENEKKISEDNVIDQCLKANLSNRAMSSADIKDYSFDCNIQQVKRKEFDILYYGLFFNDIIEIYQISSDEIIKCPKYSDKQHRGNKGEGQFHLNKSTIDWHRKNCLKKTLTYDELYKLFDSCRK